MQAKKLLEDSPKQLAEGRASYIKPLLEMLDKASVKYHIEPVWPYSKSYEEHVAAKLKEADQKAADGIMDYYTTEEIRDKLEAVIETRQK